MSNTTFIDHYGKRRAMTQRDLDAVMAKVRPGSEARFVRLPAASFPAQPVGPFRYNGTRSDDPNDTVPHEHRRDLRGLRVFAAWLGHDDSKSLNTLDTLVKENGAQYLRHYLIDFGASLGSASYGPNSPRSGNEYSFDWGFASRQFVSLGLVGSEVGQGRSIRTLPRLANSSTRCSIPSAGCPNIPTPRSPTWMRTTPSGRQSR